MPTASTMKNVLWALAAVAVVSRVPMARSFVFNSGS